MNILIKNGRVIDPYNNVDENFDIFIEHGLITKIGKNLDITAEKVIDGTDKWVVPGFIDLHVHLREPGGEHKEDIASGSKSAAKGGYTTICAMPNTNPCVDNKEIVEFIINKGKETSINVLPIGSITKGMLGKECSNIVEMTKSGICAISEDGRTVVSHDLMQKGMEIAKDLKLPVFCHCEHFILTGKGLIAQGNASEKLGIIGIPAESEYNIVSRDLALSLITKAHVHICHISRKESVELVRLYKKIGANVTAEATPHHFTLTDEHITRLDGNYKMAPPLGTFEDRQAVINGLSDGTIDAIATDHAPHCGVEKSDFHSAPNGIIGLETAFPLAYSGLVLGGILKPIELIRKMSTNCSNILDIKKGRIGIGCVADIAVLDVENKYKIDAKSFVSKSKNSPFDGREVYGRNVCTISSGKVIYEFKGECYDC